MFRENKKKILWLVALLSLARVVSPQQDLSDFEKRLAKINATIRSLRAKIKEEDRKESTVLSQLDRIAMNKRLIRTELQLYGAQMDQIAQELDSIKKSIAERRQKLQDQRQAIAKTLVTLYKYGKFDFLQFLLQAESMSVVFSESKNLSFLARYQQDIVAAYLRTLSELDAAEKAQEEKRAEYARLIEETGQKKKELEAEEAENRALVQQIRKHKETYQRALDEQSERGQHLQSLMDKLASQEVVLPFRFVPFYEKKGKLPWPIAVKKIISRFGLERHPQFRTVTMNNGIEISPREDSAVVRAVHPGKVVYADYFQGYGNLIIIDHGLNYYSLYGHCADFMVDKGDYVREEQPIAVVGDSGSLQGICLYLEFRYKTKPLDPLQWLKRR